MVCFQAEAAAVTDMVEKNILELLITKHWALKFATSAACTVLKVDQVSVCFEAPTSPFPSGFLTIYELIYFQSSHSI
jgi:chaperonin GroEL (HSP60 family)